MNTIEISDVKLMSMHVCVNEKNIRYDPKNVQAMLQVQYNLTNKKSISYKISVGESQEHSLYQIKCEYSFCTNDDDFIEQDIIKEVMDILQPRIEEILSLITMEAGYVNFASN